MCSRKWLSPFDDSDSKRDPTRTYSATCARWSCGWGTTTTRSPLSSVAVRWGRSRIFAPSFFFVERRRSRPRVAGLCVDHVLLVDLDVGLRRVAQAPDEQRERLGLLLREHELDVGVLLLRELVGRRRLVRLQANGDEAVVRAEDLAVA